MIDLEPLGDRAFLARFDDESTAQAWARALRAAAWAGIEDVATAYSAVAVFANPDAVDVKSLEARLRALASAGRAATRGREIPIPVLYDGADLGALADRLAVTVSDLIAIHSGAAYVVQAIGFLPGFPYCGPLPEPIAGVPRLPEPRARVPRGSVAIAGRQTAIYPAESPGGWHLLGRTPLRIVDVDRGVFPIRTGDRLRFSPIDQAAFAQRDGELLCPAPST